MKLATSLILPALSWTARLASATTEARVYICDGRAEEATDRTLSPTEARLVIAQRAGVEDYHSAELKDGKALDAINVFGRTTSLFENEDRRKQVEEIVLVEGGGDVEINLSQQCRSFAISPVSDVASTRRIWVDLVRQASPAIQSSSTTDESIVASLRDGGVADGRGKTFRIVSRGDPLLNLMDPMQSGMSSTLLFAPTTRITEKESQWGTYSMPGAQSPLRKRQARSSPPQPEAPLEIDPLHSFQPVEASNEASDIYLSANNNTNASQPLTGILPACFTTQESCESSTRSCMGHGACALLFTDQSASPQSPSQHCYACACSPTTSKSSDGKLVTTTYWGGPACQKKDISMEFWMLALFSVGLVFLVSFAIGELMGMGGEELPSVIGAGVSGPTAKK
ncbi:hypothetical protein LTR91_005194 [Friedmanniomyces endolithicus]|uniref:DUF3844 domain-containing protein n=1 Tax=Friedmanniomyces endolithicus TaxID=329885 RepID=A0AAN6QXZ0_9PEZI|nr:hypothetical protein LTR57_003598 [Friedmanniomyces endolithicus]KAK0976851.1 hypothetical protein LTS01_013333 [Friedmanniomyces endolithicus]KAK1002098.1 hypothetical protein LTR91_005194 [Friedmanniomyces endolithicus]KAK1043699.1 hypothetical protein LTS16_007797 [Friedmanniomyces endolithicus]